MMGRLAGAPGRGGQWARGEGRGARRSRAAIIGLAVFTAHGATGASPFDFTGHWTGTSLQEGQPANALVADFTSTGPKTFTGTVTADNPCSAAGKLKRHMKLAVHLDCGDG